MNARSFSLAAVLLLLGCGDGATATEFGDASTTPADTAQSEAGDSASDTTADETTPPGDTAGDTTAPPTDSASGSTAMKCGLLTCNTTTQDCCITAGVGVCIAKGGLCASGRYSCTTKANCGAGQVCCISGAGTGGASCAAESACPSTRTCETDADCSGSLKKCVDISGGVKACSNK